MPKVVDFEVELGGEVKHHSKVDNRADRKDPRRCPVCMAKLSKIGKGTRYQHSCKSCHSCLAKEIKCRYCSTFRVWRGKQGVYCHGCGKSNA